MLPFLPWQLIKKSVFILLGALLFCYVIYLIMKTPSRAMARVKPAKIKKERIASERIPFEKPGFKPAAERAKPAKPASTGKDIWERKI